jgi:hypothetical protein
MATADEFRAELRRQLQQAEAAGRDFIDVRCSDVYDPAQRLNPTDTPRFANCCNVMRQEYRPDVDHIISRGGDGPNFAIRYRLPRPR